MRKSLLLFALHILQGECNEHSYCNDSCPFYTDEECGIQNDPPSEWDILEEEPVDHKLLF